MLEKYLQDLGLSEKEAALYLALIQVDNASVIELSKKTKINRTTVYVILDSLEKKGLISETTIGKKTHYQAEPPERLETYIERRRVVLEEQAKRLKDVIPQIKSVQRESGERPIVKYFEGRDGIIAANDEFFLSEEKGGTTYLIYPKDMVDEIFTPKEREKYRSARLNKNILSKVLYTSVKGEVASDATGQRVKIDEQKYPLLCDISVYGDKVRISILGKPLSAIFIKSKDFAETLKSIFELAYNNINTNNSNAKK